MAERYRFFDSADPLNPDRTYNAQEFTDYFKALVTTGLMKGAGNELIVSTSGSNMVSTIDSGIAFIMGRYYENDSPLNLTHDTESLGKNRIDRIVVRLDLNTEARYVRAFIKKGVASSNPVAPALQRDGLVYEISLAQVKIIGGQTYINKADVIDEREDGSVCGWAGSNILPNFNDEALEQLIDDVENMYQLTDGPYAKKYSGDLNNLVETGYYYVPDNTPNAPDTFSSDDGIVEVVVAKSEDYGSVTMNVIQKIHHYGNVYSPKQSYRRVGEYYEGFGWSWGKWIVEPSGKLEEPINVVLTSTWIFPNHASYPDLTYYKDDFGIVYLSGSIKKLNTFGSSHFTTLPEGYRPNKRINMVGINLLKGETGLASRKEVLIEIDSNGFCRAYDENENDIILINGSFRSYG